MLHDNVIITQSTFCMLGNKGFQNKSQVSIVAYRGSYTSDYFIFKFIKRAFGEFKKFNMK